MADYTQSELMIGGTDLKAYGLTVLKAEGFWNWPKMKIPGTDWKDQNYMEPSTRLIDCQYESRTITIDCIVVGTSWGTLKSNIASVIAALHFDGCKMLICEKYSLRGYIVRLKKIIPVKSNVFRLSRSIAEFKLVFEEPQPFNVQFTFDDRWRNDEDLPMSYDLSIENPLSGIDTASNKQQYIRVWHGSTSTEVNLQKGSYSATITTTTTNRLCPVVITGEIDTINSIEIETTGVPVFTNEAGLFLRNGTLTFIEL